MFSLRDIFQAIENGGTKDVEKLIPAAISEGCSAAKILDCALLPAMESIGAKYKGDEFYIASVINCARAMKRSMELLRPYLDKEGKKQAGKVIIGTVAGDLHDLGKNLVVIMLESYGFNVTDLGVDVTKQKFLNAIASSPDVTFVGLSALLSTTLSELKNTVKSINELPNRKNFIVMVGGGVVTKAFADEIGADIYTENAFDAATIAGAIAEGRKPDEI